MIRDNGSKGELFVVIGVGGMGLAMARRLGPGRRILLADHDGRVLAHACEQLANEGFDVVGAQVDVGNEGSVTALARTSAQLGPVALFAHTAGLSPAQAEPGELMRVDLLGVAHTLEAFGTVVGCGAAGLVISSMAGHFLGPLDPADEAALAMAPAAGLLELPVVQAVLRERPDHAYRLAKRGNQLRVQGASVSWGRAGARINSISPGHVATPMGRLEALHGANAQRVAALISGSAAGRQGTPQDIANAAAFLLSPDAAFITGTDLLMDGGAVPGARWN